MWSKQTLVYVAGLLEGEGYFTATKVGNYKYPRIGCDMSDQDVIEDLQEMLGCGTLYSRKRAENRKKIYGWRLLSKRKVLKLAKALYPYMKSRRQKQIDKLIPLCVYKRNIKE